MAEGDLGWGETPFDHLTRDEMLRELQRMYSALVSLDSVAHMTKANNPRSPFWGFRGTGGCALEKARQILEPIHAKWDAETIYRSFFRYATDLLFEDTGYSIGFRWSVCPTCGTMLGEAGDGTPSAGRPCPAFAGDHAATLRPLTWDDLLPTAINAGGTDAP